MLTLKVTRPNGTRIKATTTGSQLRLRIGRKPAAKTPVPTIIERTAVLVPVPVVRTVFVAPPPAPTADEIAYAILRRLEGAQRLRRDLDQTEEEVVAGQNGQPHYRYFE